MSQHTARRRIHVRRRTARKRTRRNRRRRRRSMRNQGRDSDKSSLALHLDGAKKQVAMLSFDKLCPAMWAQFTDFIVRSSCTIRGAAYTND
jgi:hypothetical protein